MQIRKSQRIPLTKHLMMVWMEKNRKKEVWEAFGFLN